MVIPHSEVFIRSLSGIHSTLDHRGEVEKGKLVGIIRKKCRVQDVVPGLVTERKAIAMALVVSKESIIDNYSPCFGANVFGLVG